jgi:hypothetical protein
VLGCGSEFGHASLPVVIIVWPGALARAAGVSPTTVDGATGCAAVTWSFATNGSSFYRCCVQYRHGLMQVAFDPSRGSQAGLGPCRWTACQFLAIYIPATATCGTQSLSAFLISRWLIDTVTVLGVSNHRGPLHCRPCRAQTAPSFAWVRQMVLSGR